MIRKIVNAAILAGLFSIGSTSAFAGLVTTITPGLTINDFVTAGDVVDIDGSLTPYDNSTSAVFSGDGSLAHPLHWGSSATGGESTLVFIPAPDYSYISGQSHYFGTLVLGNGTSDLNTLIFGFDANFTGGAGVTPFVVPAKVVTTANTLISKARDADYLDFSAASPPFALGAFEGGAAVFDLTATIVGDPDFSDIVFDIAPSGLGSSVILPGDPLAGGKFSVPEPGTLTLFGVGVLAFGGLRRRLARKNRT